VFQIAGAIHDGHSALADLILDRVPVAQGGHQALDHCSKL